MYNPIFQETTLKKLSLQTVLIAGLYPYQQHS